MNNEQTRKKRRSQLMLCCRHGLCSIWFIFNTNACARISLGFIVPNATFRIRKKSKKKTSEGCIDMFDSMAKANTSKY